MTTCLETAIASLADLPDIDLDHLAEQLLLAREGVGVEISDEVLGEVRREGSELLRKALLANKASVSQMHNPRALGIVDFRREGVVKLVLISEPVPGGYHEVMRSFRPYGIRGVSSYIGHFPGRSLGTSERIWVPDSLRSTPEGTYALAIDRSSGSVVLNSVDSPNVGISAIGIPLFPLRNLVGV